MVLSPMQNVSFRLASGESLDVRTFSVTEKIGTPFAIELIARSPDPDLDLEGFVGEPARFEIAHGRSWVGAVRAFELVQAEPTGLSTYRVELVPALWLLTQRRNHRIFQRMTEPEMAMQLLAEWKIAFEARLDAATYKKRDYRVQYGESDFAFLSRMLEDAGVSYWFETSGDQTKLVLCDAPQSGEARAPVHHCDDPSTVPYQDFVTALSVVREVKPGKYTVRDIDFRIPPSYPLLATHNAPAKHVEATPKPKVSGVESATVVGARGEEIHTDEFGRVRVHFHWDRESQMDDNSSCWIHVSQPWGGTGFGGRTCRASDRRSSSTSSAAIRTARSSWAASSRTCRRRPTSCPTTRRRAAGRAALRPAGGGTTTTR
jgi:uncharacterized protein involved in type VI secretion and phage assembly